MENELKFTPAVFDPNEEQLQAIALEVSQITANPAEMTKETLELISTTKNKLVKARTSIEKAGKKAREAANKYNKDVIEYEDKLIAIIEPEEKRLKEIEASAKDYAMKQERLKTLPEFKEKLTAIGDGITMSDEDLLVLNPNERTEYYNERLGKKLEADKAAADAKRAEEDRAKEAEAKKLEEEKEIIEREKQAIIKEKQNLRLQAMLNIGMKKVGSEFKYEDISLSENEVYGIEDDNFNNLVNEVSNSIHNMKITFEKEAEEKRQAEIKEAQLKAKEEAEQEAEKRRNEEAAARQREEDERKEKLEQDELARKKEEQERTKAEKYEKWLTENSYNDDTDIVEYNVKTRSTTLYRKVSEFKHE